MKQLILLLLFTSIVLAAKEANFWPKEELDKVRNEKKLWHKNNIGKSSKVMKPYLPLKYANGTIKTLVWNITHNKTVFPEKISNKKWNLLTSAPFIRLKTKKGDLIIKKGNVKVLNTSEIAIKLVSSSAVNNITANVEFDYEFDGMSKVTLNLSSKVANTNLNGVELVIPLNKEFASYYHYFISGHHPIKPFNASGATPKQGFILNGFRNQVWLGSAEAGFSFFAEGMQNWQLKDEKAIQTVSQVKGNTRYLTVKFANKPFNLNKPLKIVFGLQPTPAKYREYDFRRRSDQSTVTWLWQKWGDGAAHPFDDSKEAKEYILKCRKAGKEVMPYSSTHYYGLYRYNENMFGKIKDFPGLIHPELKLWGPKWSRKVLNNKNYLKAWKPAGGKAFIDTASIKDDKSAENFQNKKFKPIGLVELCPNSDYQDYYLWRLKNTVDKTTLKTIYLDSGTNSCGNKLHGCGYYDYKGKWRETAPFFAARQMIKRMRQIFYDKFGETRICLHVSCHLETPFFSFIDTHLSAEQYAYEPFSVKEFYSELLTTDIMIPEHTGIPFGVAGEFLPVFNFFWRDYRAPSPASIRDLCGFAFIHDVNPSPKDTRFNDLISFYQSKRLQFFPRLDKVARYWEKNLPYEIKPNVVKGILHWNKSEALLIIFNWSSQVNDAKIKLDFARIFGSKNSYILEDVINNSKFTSNNGTFSIPVAPRDFRMLKVVKVSK